MQTESNIRLANAQYRIWIIRGVAVALTVGLLAMSAPRVWAAVTAGAGILVLAALAALAATGFVALQMIPLAMQKVENRILCMRKDEARQNPIEHLQNECLRREERLQSFRRALVRIGGQIESMGQMIDERRPPTIGKYGAGALKPLAALMGSCVVLQQWRACSHG